VRVARGSHTGLVPEAVPVPLRDTVRPVRRGEDGLRIEPVIATKFFVPGLGVRSVERPRLLRALHRALDCRLTLVVAAAGWGKSTAIAQWLRGAAVPFGWLSLDAADGDVTRFWRHLLTAVQQAAPDTGAALRRLEAAGADVERDVLPVAVNELTDTGRDIVVVLDDYHLVADLAVHRSLAALVERAPPCLHLVIASRTDPPLPLSRLRVAGQLADVRADQLGFTADEAARLLAGAVAEVSPQDVTRLVERTEGWAAGLQLAGLRLAGRVDRQARTEFIARFTGADRHVVDYLGEEVLAALPGPVHDFLLQTSVLPRLCVPLADAVTGRDDAASMLAAVEKANLFLIALDDEGRWFRYHQLFRDLLRLELDRAGVVPARVLHQRASGWFCEQGLLPEAIEHALSAGDAGTAGELIASGWRAEFNRGHLRTVQAWVDRLPPGAASGDPRLTVAQLWLQLDRGRLEEAGATLAAAGARAADDGHVQVLRALHTFKSGNVPLAAERLAVVHGRLTDPFLLTVQDLVAGVCALWLGGTAVERLRRAAARAQDTGNRLARIYALGAAALAAVIGEDRPAAERLLAEAEDAVADGLVDVHFVAMFPALATARLAGARGRWEDAAAAAASAAELGSRGAGRVEHAAALVTAGEACRRAGEGDGIREETWLAQAADVLRGCADPGPVARDWFLREQRARREDHRAAPTGPERLTERELAILALLPTPLSQRELAGSLFVSQNTLKTHLRAVYRKLGVDSRDQAVLRARSLGLL
jgi:LuxR family transcriptional regulator, maltose regulon positive regulatory protein